jgi:ribonuclease P protein component
MVFAPVWRPLAAARSLPIAVPKAAPNSLPDFGLSLEGLNLVSFAPRETLSPPDRFKLRADFLRLASRGRKIARPGFVMQILRSDTATPLRVGYTATKKIGNAVARNRARRRLKEAARLELVGAGQLTGVELVLICRQETARLPFETLRANLRTVLAEATR